jgi:dihydrofolate reductase
MKISLIAAMAENRVIGSHGQMPWHLPADLKRFKQITWGAPVLMGRKTFDAIGRPLPGRTNIVISKNKHYAQPDCLVFNDLETALHYCADCQEVFVIGGATLYQALLQKADYLYLTEIKKQFVGDTYFPEVDMRNWQEVDRLVVDADQQVDFKYDFVKYARLKLFE